MNGFPHVAPGIASVKFDSKNITLLMAKIDLSAE